MSHSGSVLCDSQVDHKPESKYFEQFSLGYKSQYLVSMSPFSSLSCSLSLLSSCTNFFFKVQVATSAMSTTFVGFSPIKIILPDLVSHCAFPIKVNRHRKQAGAASKKWLFRGDNLTLKKRRAFHGLKAGLLTSMCYPDAGYPQLRVCCDFMNCKCMATRNVRHIYSINSIRVADLFHLDNLSDDMDTTGTQSTADVVMNSLYHPNTYYSSSRVGRMTKEYAKHFLFDMSMAHL